MGTIHTSVRELFSDVRKLLDGIGFYKVVNNTLDILSKVIK